MWTKDTSLSRHRHSTKKDREIGRSFRSLKTNSLKTNEENHHESKSHQHPHRIHPPIWNWHTGIYTFDTKSYAIWQVLKRFRSGPRTAEAFVSDILERLELPLGQVDDWTIQEIAVEPNQTAITTNL